MKKTYQYIMLKQKKEIRNSRIQARNQDIEKKKAAFEERKEALDNDHKTSYTAIVER